MDITLQEYLAVTSLAFTWANSADSKDWERLRSILAASIEVDYTLILGPGNIWEAMTPDDFVALFGGPSLLGDPLVASQHLLGGASWERVGADEIVSKHQLRAAHLRYSEVDENGVRGGQVVGKCHGHTIIQHRYRKGMDGVWKMARVKPEVPYFTEGSMDEIFKRPGS